MSIAEEIRSRLEDAFQPTRLEVHDDSEAHRGHAGFREGGESHFHVTLAAPTLTPLSRMERHRAVHAAIGRDLMGRIHALSLTITEA